MFAINGCYDKVNEQHLSLFTEYIGINLLCHVQDAYFHSVVTSPETFEQSLRLATRAVSSW